MQESISVPTPDEAEEDEVDTTRLWIGNMDERITEYVMLKLLQKFGTLKKFDFLYVTTGPDQGKSRGYCFATYSKQKESEDAIKGLNGKRALSKRLVVKYATAKSHAVKKELISLNGCSKNMQKSDMINENISNEVQINAIEAKLKSMKELDDAGSSSCLPSSSGPSSVSLSKRKCVQYAVPQKSSSRSQQERNSKSHKTKKHFIKPYHKIK